jgi:hypothetical protein
LGIQPTHHHAFHLGQKFRADERVQAKRVRLGKRSGHVEAEDRTGDGA